MLSLFQTQARTSGRREFDGDTGQVYVGCMKRPGRGPRFRFSGYLRWAGSLFTQVKRWAGSVETSREWGLRKV